MWQFELLCWLTISSLTLSVPITDFFNFDMGCNIVNMNCTEIVFPRKINVTIPYSVSVLFPFFDSTVIEIHVSPV